MALLFAHPGTNVQLEDSKRQVTLLEEGGWRFRSLWQEKNVNAICVTTPVDSVSQTFFS